MERLLGRPSKRGFATYHELLGGLRLARNFEGKRFPRAHVQEAVFFARDSFPFTQFVLPYTLAFDSILLPFTTKFITARTYPRS